MSPPLLVGLREKREDSDDEVVEAAQPGGIDLVNTSALESNEMPLKKLGVVDDNWLNKQATRVREGGILDECV
jgi:hypothetical protein